MPLSKPLITAATRSLGRIRKHMTDMNSWPCAFAMSPFSVQARMPLPKIIVAWETPDIMIFLAIVFAHVKSKAPATTRTEPKTEEGFVRSLGTSGCPSRELTCPSREAT